VHRHQYKVRVLCTSHIVCSKHKLSTRSVVSKTKSCQLWYWKLH
jgi:hypothetical protein